MKSNIQWHQCVFQTVGKCIYFVCVCVDVGISADVRYQKMLSIICICVSCPFRLTRPIIVKSGYQCDSFPFWIFSIQFDVAPSAKAPKKRIKITNYKNSNITHQWNVANPSERHTFKYRHTRGKFHLLECTLKKSLKTRKICAIFFFFAWRCHTVSSFYSFAISFYDYFLPCCYLVRTATSTVKKAPRILSNFWCNEATGCAL